MKLADLTTTPFQWGSALRQRRVFHPNGVFATGEIQRVAPADSGLPVPSAPVIARLSKAAGTPGPLPDAVGLALRIPQADSTADWDILLASAGSSPLGRVLGLRPVFSWSGGALTSLMPLRYRGTNWWLRARVTTEIGGSGLSLDSVRNQLRTGNIEVDLDQARGASSFTPLAHITLTDIVTPAPDDDVAFDPVLHTVQGVEMYPRWLADLRGNAYERSREGRDAD
jgi:hypothetical protein